MSSTLVLARKYRPRDFHALVGQEHVVQALANALTRGRLHHAYLFTGTRGVGKTTVSRILAKSLNCTGPDGTGGITAQPCGVCDACRDIDSGRFVDYVELDAASNRGVEEISQLLDQAVYKPVMGRYKVYMIDEVHMLSNHAFNAMLKTLEEPPDYLKFVLATTDPQKVPPTVLSRCLQFNLRPMAPLTVQEHLSTVLQAEGIEADVGALRLLSRAARGSMRDALSLTDQAIAFGAGALAEAGVRQMLGAVDRGHAMRLIAALAQGDGAALVAGVEGLRTLGLSAAGALEELAALLQQIAVHHAVPDALDPADPDAPGVKKLATLLAADETQLLYSIVLHGRAELGLAPDEYSALLMVLLRGLAFFRPAGAPRVESTPLTFDTPEAAAPAASTVSSLPAAAVVPHAPARAAAVDVPRAAPAGVPATPSTLLARAPVADSPRQSPAVPNTLPTRGASDAPPVVLSAAPAPAVSAPLPRSAPVPSNVAAHEPPPWMDVPAVDEDSPWVGEAPSDDAGWGDDLPTPRRVAAATLAPAAGAPAGAAAPAKARVADADTAAAAAPSDTRPVLQTTALGERWDGLVQQMMAAGSISALVRELAVQAECVAVDDTQSPAVWRLRVERDMLRSAANIDKLQAAVRSVLDAEVRLEVLAGVATDTPALRATAERDRRQRAAEDTIHNDPLVRSLLAQFSTARIVPGSIRPH